GDAWPAPGRPEVDDDDLVGQGLGRVDRAGGVEEDQGRQAVWGARPAGRRGLFHPELDPVARGTQAEQGEGGQAGQGGGGRAADHGSAPHRNLRSDGARSSGGARPRSSRHVLVTLAMPAPSGATTRYRSPRAAWCTMNGTGLRLCEVRAT